MNSSEAKSIPLADILSDLGYPIKQVKKDGGEFWYLSPFREEKTPSFHINVTKNIWYDFGLSQGGNVLDFIMAYKHTNFRGAMVFMADRWGRGLPQKTTFQATSRKPNLISSKPIIATENQEKPVLGKIQTIQHPALIEYLQVRKIPLEIAAPYLKEIYYRQKSNRYFTLGMQNIANGWEIRNKFFKGCLGKKDFSIFKNEEANRNEQTLVFEGMFDFLSYLAYRKTTRLDLPVCVLHSLMNLPRLIEFLKENNITSVLSYLDNDPSGQEGVSTLSQHFGEKHIAMNDLYQGFKDLNEWWVRQAS